MKALQSSHIKHQHIKSCDLKKILYFVCEFAESASIDTYPFPATRDEIEMNYSCVEDASSDVAGFA